MVIVRSSVASPQRRALPVLVGELNQLAWEAGHGHLLLLIRAADGNMPFIRYHKKNVIFEGNFNFQMIWLCSVVLGIIIPVYIEGTMNHPFSWRD
jgi:hypothetical protein